MSRLFASSRAQNEKSIQQKKLFLEVLVVLSHFTDVLPKKIKDLLLKLKLCKLNSVKGAF